MSPISQNHKCNICYNEQIGAAVADQAVSLHFAYTIAASFGSALQRLSCKFCIETFGSGVYFVLHHMLQSLIEYGTREDVTVQVLASDARDQRVFTIIRETLRN